MHLTILMIPLFSICPGCVSCFNDWFSFFLFWLLFVCLIPLHSAELVTKRVRLQSEVPVYSALPPTEVFFSFLYNLVCLSSCLTLLELQSLSSTKNLCFVLDLPSFDTFKGSKVFPHQFCESCSIGLFFFPPWNFCSRSKSSFFPLMKGLCPTYVVAERVSRIFLILVMFPMTQLFHGKNSQPLNCYFLWWCFLTHVVNDLQR